VCGIQRRDDLTKYNKIFSISKYAVSVIKTDMRVKTYHFSYRIARKRRVSTGHINADEVKVSPKNVTEIQLLLYKLNSMLLISYQTYHFSFKFLCELYNRIYKTYTLYRKSVNLICQNYRKIKFRVLKSIENKVL
jgi:hypothetical protein